MVGTILVQLRFNYVYIYVYIKALVIIFPAQLPVQQGFLGFCEWCLKAYFPTKHVVWSKLFETHNLTLELELELDDKNHWPLLRYTFGWFVCQCCPIETRLIWMHRATKTRNGHEFRGSHDWCSSQRIPRSETGSKLLGSIWMGSSGKIPGYVVPTFTQLDGNVFFAESGVKSDVR